jgi:hypothetical protein
MYDLSLLTTLLIATSILYVGRLISKDLNNLRRAIMLSGDAVAHAIQKQTEALIEGDPLDSGDEGEEDEGTLPENS